MKKWFIILFCVTISGCLGPVRELYPEDEEMRPYTIYVVGISWHTGIVVERSALIEKVPYHERIPNTEYLKFGWGDRGYYMDPEAGFGRMLSAALLPTRSVLHVVGIDIPIEHYFSASDVIKVQLSEKGLEKLIDFIADRFRKNDDGSLIFEGDGLYGQSAFFLAEGRYYLPKTSNTWAARSLRAAGCPITPLYSFTVGNVIYQTRQFGEVIQRKPGS